MAINGSIVHPAANSFTDQPQVASVTPSALPDQTSTQQDGNLSPRRPSMSGPPPSYMSRRGSLSCNPPFVAADHSGDNKKHLLLCASGSVATIKIPLICGALAPCDRLSIRIIFTKSAAQFLAGQAAEQPTVQSLLNIPNVEAIYFDEDEWNHPWTRGAPILHIELRRWADICVVAPLSANTMAKMVNGIADSLLTSVLRCWDTDGSIENRGRSVEGGLRKRIIVAPAMNNAMMLHPVTDKQIKVLNDEWGITARGRRNGSGWVEVLMPSKRELACGDVGVGAMLHWEQIVQTIRLRLWLNVTTRPQTG